MAPKMSFVAHPVHQHLKVDLTSRSRKLILIPITLDPTLLRFSIVYETDFRFLFLFWAFHQPVKGIPFKGLNDITQQIAKSLSFFLSQFLFNYIRWQG